MNRGTGPGAAPARQLRIAAVIAVLAMSPLVFYFTTEGTWNVARQREGTSYGARFFLAQAEAMTRGRLDVPHSELNGECWDRGAGCYGYFGVTPSLLRLPVIGVLHGLDSAMTPLYLGAAVLLAYWAALRLVRRGLLQEARARVPDRAVLGYFVVAALSLGPGGSLMFLVRPSMFEEAIAWSVAFFLLSLDRVWEWHQTRTWRPLVLAVLFGVAAANARPTAIVGCAALGVTVAILSRVRRTAADGPRLSGRRELAAALCVSLLPLLTATGVYWLKFRTPLPNPRVNEQVRDAPYWREIRQTNGDRTGGLIFLPTALVAYFRPDGVIWGPAWPYADFAYPHRNLRWVPPLPAGGAYLEAHASLTSTMPLPWTIVAILVLWLGTSRARSPDRADWVLVAGLLASACAMVTPTVTAPAIINRYLGDFLPISVVAMATGHRAILPVLATRPLLRAAAASVAIVLAGWSIVVTCLLSTRVVF